jgi:hypothetical protein
MPKNILHSCGALFFSVNTKGDRGIILGREWNKYYVFKGKPTLDEIKHHSIDSENLYKITACREIFEESCGLINIDYRTIKLDHVFSKRNDKYIKIYHIGLIYVPYSFIDKFNKKRLESQLSKEFMEKQEVKFFKLEDVQKSKEIADITKRSINFYKDKMQKVKIISNGVTVAPRNTSNVLLTVYDLIACSSPVNKLIEMLSPNFSEDGIFNRNLDIFRKKNLESPIQLKKNNTIVETAPDKPTNRPTNRPTNKPIDKEKMLPIKENNLSILAIFASFL